MKNRIILFILFSGIYSIPTFSQIKKNTFGLSGIIQYTKSNYPQKNIHFSPEVSYYLTSKIALGYSYTIDKKGYKYSTSQSTTSAHGFNLTFNHLTNKSFYLIGGPNILFGTIKNDQWIYAGDLTEFDLGFKIGLQKFINNNIAFTIIPIQFTYSEFTRFETEQNYRFQKNSTLSANIAPFKTSIGISYFLNTNQEIKSDDKPELIYKKIIGGDIFFNQNKASDLSTNFYYKDKLIQIMPTFGSFFSSSIAAGFKIGYVGTFKDHRLSTNSTEKTNEQLAQISPYIKLYKWFGKSSGVFVEPQADFGMGKYSYRNSSQNMVDESGSYLTNKFSGGINVGFALFLTERLLLEGYTQVFYIINPLYFYFLPTRIGSSVERSIDFQAGPNLSNIKLSLSVVLGKGKSKLSKQTEAPSNQN